MKFQKIILMRHGLATYSTTGYGDKIFSATILPESIPSIEKTAEYVKKIPTDYNVSSEFLRCRQTVQIVSAMTKKQFVFDKRINEFNEETFSNFKERLQNFLDELLQKNVKNILICTHGAVIAGLKQLVLTNNFQEEQLLDFPIPGVLTILENDQIQEINFNIKK